MTLTKMTILSWVALNMNKYSSIEAIDASNLSDQTKFRWNEINKDYFNSKGHERKTMGKRLSKYIAAFDYLDKNLIVLSATSGGVFNIFFASVIGVNAGTTSASFTIVFSLSTVKVKKVLKITNKKRKHNKILVLAKSKWNSIETLISQALIDLGISHEEFKSIVKEREEYEKMKEIIRMTKNSGNLGENNRSYRKKY